MKATISKNYKFIQLNFPPTTFEAGGLRILHTHETKYHYPRGTTDLLVGKKRYSLMTLPKKTRESIYAIEVRQDGYWWAVELKDNNVAIAG